MKYSRAEIQTFDAWFCLRETFVSFLALALISSGIIDAQLSDVANVKEVTFAFIYV
jgi:hypothetical protein